VFTGMLTRSTMNFISTEAAEDAVSRRWVVEAEASNEVWNAAIRSYTSLNVKIYRWPLDTYLMANQFHAKELDVKYGMSVEVAAPIQKHSPKVSFVYRHQIHCWVAVDNSKAGYRGIIAVTANYIPDICTERRLWIQESPQLNLVQEGNVPESDTSTEPKGTSEGVFSFATATIPAASKPSRRTFGSIKRKLLRHPQNEAVQDIPIYNHVCQGWDYTNSEWQKIIWPKLDCNLQPLQGQSTEAWRLDWGSRGGAGSSITNGISPEGPELPDTVLKQDNGKGREIG